MVQLWLLTIVSTVIGPAWADDGIDTKENDELLLEYLYRMVEQGKSCLVECPTKGSSYSKDLKFSDDVVQGPIIDDIQYLLVACGEGEAQVVATESYVTNIVWNTLTSECSFGEWVKSEAVVSGYVLDGEGKPIANARVYGCHGYAHSENDGKFLLEVVPGDCTITAMRRDGGIQVFSDPVDIKLVLNEKINQNIIMDSREYGGIGVSLLMGQPGLVIDNVTDGSAADRSGIRKGDQIISINGKLVEGDFSSFEEVYRELVGPIGTSVSIIVKSEDELLELTLVRSKTD